MFSPIPCYQSQRGEDNDCGAWLRGASTSSPHHVCYDIACESVEMFASEHYVITCQTDTRYLAEWPLPVGANSILDWLTREQTQGIETPNTWFAQPILQKDDARVGLAAYRQSETGHTWLLGLVKVLLPPPQPPADASVDELRLYVEGLRRPCYVFTDMALLIEGKGQLQAAEVLSHWYECTILGTTLSHRPPGSGTFASADEFMSTLRDAVRAVRSAGLKPTQKNVGQFLNADERQLRRWCRKYTGLSWRELLKPL